MTASLAAISVIFFCTFSISSATEWPSWAGREAPLLYTGYPYEEVIMRPNNDFLVDALRADVENRTVSSLPFKWLLDNGRCPNKHVPGVVLTCFGTEHLSQNYWGRVRGIHFASLNMVGSMSPLALNYPLADIVDYRNNSLTLPEFPTDPPTQYLDVSLNKVGADGANILARPAADKLKEITAHCRLVETSAREENCFADVGLTVSTLGRCGGFDAAATLSACPATAQYLVFLPDAAPHATFYVGERGFGYNSPHNRNTADGTPTTSDPSELPLIPSAFELGGREYDARSPLPPASERGAAWPDAGTFQMWELSTPPPTPSTTARPTPRPFVHHTNAPTPVPTAPITARITSTTATKSTMSPMTPSTAFKSVPTDSTDTTETSESNETRSLSQVVRTNRLATSERNAVNDPPNTESEDDGATIVVVVAIVGVITVIGILVCVLVIGVHIGRSESEDDYARALAASQRFEEASVTTYTPVTMSDESKDAIDDGRNKSELRRSQQAAQCVGEYGPISGVNGTLQHEYDSPFNRFTNTYDCVPPERDLEEAHRPYDVVGSALNV